MILSDKARRDAVLISKAIAEKPSRRPTLNLLSAVVIEQDGYISDLLDHKAANLREIVALKAALREALDAWASADDVDGLSRHAELRRLL